jgi:hypothetical protein
MNRPVPPTPIPSAADLADRAAEAIRSLNHTTRAGELHPADVYSVLGSLAMLAARLPQATAQLSGTLQHSLAAGGVVNEQGGDPAIAVATVAAALAEAGALGDFLAHELDRAQQATGFLSTPRPRSVSSASTPFGPARPPRQP